MGAAHAISDHNGSQRTPQLTRHAPVRPDSGLHALASLTRSLTSTAPDAVTAAAGALHSILTNIGDDSSETVWDCARTLAAVATTYGISSPRIPDPHPASLSIDPRYATFELAYRIEQLATRAHACAEPVPTGHNSLRQAINAAATDPARPTRAHVAGLATRLDMLTHTIRSYEAELIAAHLAVLHAHIGVATI